jgi:hypothetical protein
VGLHIHDTLSVIQIALNVIRLLLVSWVMFLHTKRHFDQSLMVQAPGDRGSDLSMAVLVVTCSPQQRLSVDFAVSPTHNNPDIYRIVLRTDSGFVRSFLEMSESP